VGATNNWFMPFSRLEPINVAGTARIVEFARRVKIKTLHHVSSTAVFMSLDAHKLGYLGRAHPLSQYQRHVIGYFESKWAAEILVQEAFDNGLPGTIHRPSFVGGALHSGYLPKADLTHHFLISCIELGALPDLDLLIDIVPVDVLVKAILNLAIRSEHKRRDYNLCNPGGIPLSGLRDLAAEFGVKLKLLPYSDWLLELKADPPSPSKQIIAMFCKPVPGAEDGVFAHLSKAQRLDPVNIDTEDALAGSGIDCPPVDWKMLGSYLGAIAPNQNLL
ncbi:MAG: SDR family oxidoreductase, partial [Fimbriimonadaceae bacterium]|nr:SDR family oxidoreductase [Alphaproteobacteria bacterium]